MLFFACCHATALLFVSFVCVFGRSSRLQCQLFVSVVPLVVLFSLRVSSALVFCLPEFNPLGSVVQVTIVLRHRAVLDNLTLPLPVFFSITGSSGCDSFSVLSSSDVASCERRVPRAPLCGSLRQCDRQSGTSNATTRSAPLRDRWFAVGTLASLCGSLQQRGPLSLRKFSLSGLGTTLVWGLQRELVRGKTPSTAVWHCRFHFASCAERFARCYMNFNCAAECFFLHLHAGVPTSLNSVARLLLNAVYRLSVFVCTLFFRGASLCTWLSDWLVDFVCLKRHA